jgi:ubiquitin C-terminal hydrolase
LQEALEEQYAPFEAGGESFQWFIQTVPKWLVIHLSRFRLGPHGGVKDCSPLHFRLTMSLLKVTRPIDRNGLYQLTAIVAHIGSLNEGHYITFRRIKGKWWMFDDSKVSQVKKRAVFEENFPYMTSNQTAHILVYRRIWTRNDDQNVPVHIEIIKREK